MEFETMKRIAMLESTIEVLAERGRAKDLLLAHLINILQDHREVRLGLTAFDAALTPTPTSAALRSGEVACPTN